MAGRRSRIRKRDRRWFLSCPIGVSIVDGYIHYVSIHAALAVFSMLNGNECMLLVLSGRV